MADKKISQLTAATTPLAGTEVLPIVQGGSTVKVSVDNLTAGKSVSATSFVPTGSTVPTNGIFLGAANSVSIATNSTEHWMVNASGNLNPVGTKGIGTNAAPVSETVATTFSTSAAAAGSNLSGNTLAADGTDTNIDINITPKGSGEVNITKVDIDAGAIDGTTIGANSAAAGTFSTLTSTGQATIDGIAVGQGAGNVATNTAFGVSALDANTSGSENTAIGYLAMDVSQTGVGNVAVGSNALGANTTGSNNVALGRNALLRNTTGYRNCVIGRDAMGQNIDGYDNLAIGESALDANVSGTQNVAIGRLALSANLSDSNIGIGYAAGDSITSGARNTILGDNSDISAATGTDQTVIGQGLIGKGNDTAFIGGTNGAYNEKNVTTWETTSDARIKKNIVDNTEGLEKIKKIRVRNFEYRKPEEISELPSHAAISRDGVQLGVIAQEMLPECVSQSSTGVLSVSTDPLVWYLVNAVKQLSAEIDILKSKVS